MSQSNRPPQSKKAPAKHQKPRPDFPLFPHATGRWAKKVRGKLEYFGKVQDDPRGDAALNLWLDQKDDLLAGRKPRHKDAGITVSELATQFLIAKQALRDSAELTSRTYAEYFATGERLVAEFGRNHLVSDLTPGDFGRLRGQIAKKWGAQRLANEITRVRSVFLFGFAAGLLDAPIRFGPMFARPSKKTLRKARAERGAMILEAGQIRQLLDVAGIQLKAMMLLAMNCGFGNSDCGSLPIRCADLKAGWINFPRPKTGIERRCPLWPETTAALSEVLRTRPTPKDEAHAGLLFITKYGDSWSKADRDNPVSKEFKKLLKVVDTRTIGDAKQKRTKPPVQIQRPGLGFYGLRHTFATIGGAARDQVAVNALMGHVDDSVSAMYRERIDDDRLRAVVDHVRSWLFGDGGVND